MSAVACIVIEDHYIARRGLVDELVGLPGISVVGQAAFVEEALDLADVPDVVLLDLQLPGGALEKEAAVEALLTRWPECQILVMTASEAREDILNMLAAGAKGYLTKAATPPEIADAVHKVAQGLEYVTPRLASYLLEEDRRAEDAEFVLTEREREILTLVAEGMMDKEIATSLCISVRTVHSHLERIRSKTGLRRRSELTRLALESGVANEGRKTFRLRRRNPL